jgi:beta-glucosidase
MDNENDDLSTELVKQMTLEEKAGLCSGKDTWFLKSVERLGLDPVMTADGPHGLRKQLGAKNNLEMGNTVPAVCFPTASALACSFDRELAFEVGKALGEECQQEEVSVLLGPGANQKRSPLCGRNFEYFSEDPLLTGEMAAAMINGVQSKGIGTSLKHFAVNNQEKRRMTISAVIDERAFRETYLKGFEIAVKKGKPWTVMCAYNRINGTYCSENEYLLTEILRKEWGFDGTVISDWGAVNDRVKAVIAGLEIEMPGSNGINDAKIIAAVKNGTLSEKDLDRAACRITRLILKAMEAKKAGYRYDPKEHHKLAVKAAAESAVLLQNRDNILPGKRNEKAAVIGALAKEPRYQGAGSSKIRPIRIDNAWEALKASGLEAKYALGYTVKKEKISSKPSHLDEELIKEACQVSKECDIVYLFAGLTEGYESEGFDRTGLSLPENQNRLIEAVAGVNPNIVVILSGGSPVQLPWADKVKGILLTYLGGEGAGTATADLLLGKAVPCGKLAETWPLELSDTPAYYYFPGGRAAVQYRESIFTGYRYYETAGKPVLFPFGYGLSYTDFTYSGLLADKLNYEFGDDIRVTFEVKNNGEVAAREITFLFVSKRNDKVFMPVIELVGFEKITLLPGEKKQVAIVINTKELAYYNTVIHDWFVADGDYKLMAGASVSDCKECIIIHIHNEEQPQPDYHLTAPAYYHLGERELEIPDNEFANLYGNELPDIDPSTERPHQPNHTISDVGHTLIGRLLKKYIKIMARKMTNGDPEEEAMMVSMMSEMPFYAMVTSSGGEFSENRMLGILDLLNSHYMKGIRKLIKG